MAAASVPLDRLQELKHQGWNAYEQAFHQGYSQLELARRCFSQAEQLARRSRDQSLLIGVLSGLGAVGRASGSPEDLERALRYYWEEVGILREQGRELEAACLHADLEAVYRDLAGLQPQEALRYLREGLDAGTRALEVIRRHNHRPSLARVGNAVADLCQVLSEHDPDYREFHLQMAADLYRQSLDIWDEDEEGQAVTKMGLAEVYLRLGKNLAAARMLLDEALSVYEALPGPRIEYQVAQIYALMGQLLAAEGKESEARARLRQALAIFAKLGVEPTMGRGGRGE